MNETKKLLFAMLHAAVLEPDAREQFSQVSLTEEELNALYQLAKAHDVAHLVGFALQKNEDIKSLASAKALSKAYLLAVFRREKMDYEYARICRVLEEEGIAYLPLKGAVIRTLYPEAWMRTSCDIDILVQEEALERAVEAIKKKLSYREEGPRLFHDVSLFSPGGIHLELHFTLLENIQPMDEVLDTVWEHTYPVEEGKCHYQMTAAFFLFHHIAHAANHFLKGGCGIRSFLDLYLLRQRGEVNEKELLMLLKKAGLELFYRACCDLSETWFGGEKETPLTDEMEAYLLGAGVYGSVENRVAMVRSTKKSKIAYAWKRVFMPYHLLKRYYPKLEHYPILYPYYQGKRWCRIVFGKNRGYALREMRQNAILSVSKQERIFALRSALGLEETKK